MASRQPKKDVGRDRVVKPKVDKKQKIKNLSPKQKARRKRFRRVRRVLAWTFGTIFLLLTVAVVLTAIYEDKIATALLKEVNKSLKEEIKVKTIKLDLIRNFPNASVDFKEIRVPDAYGDALLLAEQLSFKFNAMSIFGSTFKIKSIAAADGYLNVRKDKLGVVNYDIFKSSGKKETSSGDSNLAIDIKKTILQNIILDYVDEAHEQSAEIHLEYLDLSGNFSGKRTILKSNAEMLSKYVNLNGDKYLPDANVSWDFSIDADFEKGVYALNTSTLDLEANTFKASGNVTQEGADVFDTDIQLRGNDCTFRSVIALLPERYKNNIRDFNSRGNFYFNVNMKGKYDDQSIPGVRAEFGLKNGQITSPRLGESLKNVNFGATFVSKQDQDSAVFNMGDFEATLDNEALSIDLKVEDFHDPRIDFRFNGNVNMALVYKLSNNDYVKDASGKVKVQDLIFIGRYKDMIDPNRLRRVDASGIVNTENFKLKYKDELFRIQDGYLTFTNELLTVRKLELYGADSDFLLNLNLYNVLPVVLADSTEIANNDIKIRFDGELNSNNIDFDKLLKLALTQDENQKNPTPTTPTTDSADIDTVDYISKIKGRFSANVKQFNLGKSMEKTLEAR